MHSVPVRQGLAPHEVDDVGQETFLAVGDWRAPQPTQLFTWDTALYPNGDHLLRLRVERAQKLMMESDEPLAQVAFSVGFQTQAHFTTVFRRFAATTPHRWRSEQMARTPHGVAAPTRAFGSAHQA